MTGAVRYVVWPGNVTSQHDKQTHYIGFAQLAQLYGVDPRECVNGDQPGFIRRPGDLNLRPLYNGNYEQRLTAMKNQLALTP